VKICARCDQRIKDGEEYDEIPMPGASVAGATVYRHKRGCRRAQVQTTPKIPQR
jgi:hypothetical protein